MKTNLNQAFFMDEKLCSKPQKNYFGVDLLLCESYGLVQSTGVHDFWP